MNESEQFDDLTMTDELMPPPEKATMSLGDFQSGEDPEFEPIHEDDADRFIRENFEIEDVSEFEEPPDRPNSLKDLWTMFGGESDDEVFTFVHEADTHGYALSDIKNFLSKVFRDADANTLSGWISLSESLLNIEDVSEFEDPGPPPDSFLSQVFGKLSISAQDFIFDKSGVYEAGKGNETVAQDLLNKYLTALIDTVGDDPLEIEKYLRKDPRYY